MSSVDIKAWTPLEVDNIPHFVIMDFLHPEYGIIRGHLITSSSRLGDRRIESIWVHPEDHSADIWVEEFTHYKSIKSKNTK